MQNINGIEKTNRIDRPPRIAVVRNRNFQDACTAEAFKWLGGGIRLAFLGCKERVPNFDPDLARERS